MNKFKYKTKTKTPEEVMNSFKDFNKVIKKHNTILASYKAVLKFSIISTALASVFVGTYFFYPETDKHQDELYTSSSKHDIEEVSENISLQIEKTKNIQVGITPKIDLRDKKESVDEIALPMTSKTEKELLNKKESKSVDETIFKIDSTIFSKKTSTAWYTLNEKPQDETIKLPTLFISNLAWPKKINKNKLIRKPSIVALYKNIKSEIPIVNGVAYITNKNAEKKPLGYDLNGNIFPPALVRELHRTEGSCILLLKDLEIHIPGRGRINIGDQEIEIKSINNIQKKL
jgi:hypothetical protein